MKTKIYKICGVALALVLVFSLAGAFIPTNQAQAQGTTPNSWGSTGPPTTATQKLRPAGDVTDMAVAGDSKTIYSVDAAGIPDTIQLVVTAASGGATPANDVVVTIGFLNQATGAATSAATTILGTAALASVTAVVIAPATGVFDVTVATCVGATGGLAMTFNVVGVVFLQNR